MIIKIKVALVILIIINNSNNEITNKYISKWIDEKNNKEQNRKLPFQN